ncbi:MAG TPA: hypothetical protein VMS40_20495 [Vicinamibacterales bacterium]|nr:hypothetical protein [Vicinamibacterales bacterium]
MLALGLLIRAIVLPLPGTRDMGVWKIWTYNGAIQSPATLYGVGGSPPVRRVLTYHGATTTVDYPPLSLFELAAVGRAYRIIQPDLADTPALGMAIKIPLVLYEISFLFVAFFIVQRAAGRAAAQWTVFAYWLNPAPLFDASILAYLDPLFVLPLTASLFAAVGGWSFAAGALFAMAVLTKAQAVVVLPAFALALWNGGTARARNRRLAVGGLGGVLSAALIVSPVVAAGAAANMLSALQSLTRHDMLSANACNLWWIVGYILRAWYSIGSMGVWGAFTMPTKILAISRTLELGYPNPRAFGAVLALSTMCWALWTARHARDPFLIAAVAAFLVHTYATLSAQVHENHLFAAVPLLVIAGAGRPGLRPLMWTVSAIFALNLNLFYGISEYIQGYAFPRTLTIVDATVVLALVNCATLVWHAGVLRRECALPATSLKYASHEGVL